MKKPIIKSVAVHATLFVLLVSIFIYRRVNSSGESVVVSLSEVSVRSGKNSGERKTTETKHGDSKESQSMTIAAATEVSSIESSNSQKSNGSGYGDSYLTQIQQIIANHYFYPRAAIARQQEGIVFLKVFLGEGGLISNCEVLKSSGFMTLDEAAVETLKKIGTLPLPSADVHSAVIEIPIRYHIER